jgi:NAD(P)-dependent dehydrogenase (short-subunit alcohol dehydrogenase family)
MASKIFRLDGRIALVTGGGTGIGLMISQGLAHAGAKVYITGRRLEVLKKVAEEWKSGEGKGEIVPAQMDANSKESIVGVRKLLEQNEGKLHILVNNAGIVGPVSTFLNKTDSPEHASPGTLGQALFDNESFEAWSDLYKTNTFSIFFVTTAMMGLLDKGSKDVESWSSVVVNTTSISGMMKLAQDHFAYNTAKGAAGHLTRMLSTEFALKKVPIRVNAVAPGVYASEMTFDEIKPEMVDKIGKGVIGVPQKRAGT